MADLPKVLELVNKAREATGLPPLETIPRGIREDADSCPIALALDHGCTIDGETVNYSGAGDAMAGRVQEAWWPGRGNSLNEPWRITLPHELREFIKEFDGKHLPEFELEPGGEGTPISEEELL